MGLARLCATNLALPATITASSEAADRPASYLASPQRWKKWRSATSAGNQNVDVDLGAAQTIRCVLLSDWKIHTGGSVKAQYWTGAAWSDFATFTATAPNVTKVIAVWWAAGTSTSKIRILFTNTSAVNEYVELGVVFVGSYLEPTLTFQPGWGVDRRDPSVAVASIDGQRFVQRRTKYFAMSGSFYAEPEADRDALIQLVESNGIGVPVFLAVTPTNPNHILYGYLASAHPWKQQAVGRWTLPFTFEEAR